MKEQKNEDQKNLREISSRLKNIEEYQQNHVYGTLRELQGSFIQMDKRMGDFNTRITGVENRLDGMENSINTRFLSIEGHIRWLSIEVVASIVAILCGVLAIVKFVG